MDGVSTKLRIYDSDIFKFEDNLYVSFILTVVGFTYKITFWKLVKKILSTMDWKIVFLVCLQFFAHAFGQAYYAKLHKTFESETVCTVIEESYLPHYKGFVQKGAEPIKVNIRPAVRLPEGGEEDGKYTSKIVEIYAQTKLILTTRVQSMCQIVMTDKPQSSSAHHRTTKSVSMSPQEIENSLEMQEIQEHIAKNPPEIRKVVDNGDPINKIDVVFMGDGYTADERDKFFSDVSRFVREMFEEVTFKSYLPLFNIWAIYVESPESGIGYDGPKNTPFKLYREKGQLRAVFTKNARYARQVCKLTGPHACDYPSLMANDDYYGGLGGEFVIFTSSNRTGKIVLRHEMGHNFVDVGEEYDNGYAYFGANAAGSLDNLKWSRWLSGKKQEERSMYRILSYPWIDLNEREVNKTFISDGRYNRWHLTVSVTAAEYDDAIEFLIDGKPLAWKSTGSEDREFYEWSGNEGFSRGFHSFTVRSKRTTRNPKVPTMICSITLHEFGSEEEYHTDNNYISAYPTWNFVRRKSYRPTNAGCIMRNMTHDRFCPVCQEGMWHSFLYQISLIDGIDVAEDRQDDGSRQVTLRTLQLGQFRPQHQRINEEFLEINWFKEGKEQVEFRNQLNANAQPGNWSIRVYFENPEVKSDPNGVMRSMWDFPVL